MLSFNCLLLTEGHRCLTLMISRVGELPEAHLPWIGDAVAAKLELVPWKGSPHTPAAGNSSANHGLKLRTSGEQHAWLH